MTAPVVFMWDGDNMVPMQRFVPLCNRQYVVGEQYRLVPHEDRSHASHGHYFARLHEVWNNLPDRLALEYPTADKLRKWALCRTEYRNIRKIACSSNEEARRIAAFMKSMPMGEDIYVEIGINENVVVEVTPKSQSYKAMGKAAFQDSKQQVLDIVTQLIDVTSSELSDNAGRAA